MNYINKEIVMADNAVISNRNIVFITDVKVKYGIFMNNNQLLCYKI